MMTERERDRLNDAIAYLDLAADQLSRIRDVGDLLRQVEYVTRKLVVIEDDYQAVQP